MWAKRGMRGVAAVLLAASLALAARAAPVAAASGNAEANLEAGRAFLAANRGKPGVVTTDSGLQYTVIAGGDGPRPKRTDRVTVHYRGTLLDGTEFDSTAERGEPATFALHEVIPGWTEALQLMPVGSTWRLFVPPDLAYGERGAGFMIGPNQTLVFEVELLAIEP